MINNSALIDKITTGQLKILFPRLTKDLHDARITESLPGVFGSVFDIIYRNNTVRSWQYTTVDELFEYLHEAEDMITSKRSLVMASNFHRGRQPWNQ